MISPATSGNPSRPSNLVDLCGLLGIKITLRDAGRLCTCKMSSEMDRYPLPFSASGDDDVVGYIVL